MRGKNEREKKDGRMGMSEKKMSGYPLEREREREREEREREEREREREF